MEKLVPLRVMRSKTGCFQCRRRKKKCDETYPTCSGCRWNALTCQWPDPDAPSKGRRKHQHRSSDCHAANTASPFLLAHSEGPSLSYIQWPATEPHANRFFFHFIHVTSKMLSVNSKGRRTHFIQHVSTAAMSNPLVMNCVLALGAAHLSACEGKNKSFKDKGRQHYGAAISQLQENIKDTVDTPNLQQAQPVSATNNSRGLQNDGTLLAVMLLCFYENITCDDGSQGLSHLNAAAILIQERLQATDTPYNADMRGFLLEMFTYFFTLSAFSHGRFLFISQIRQLFGSPLLMRHQSYGMLLGTSRELFHIIIRFAQLCHQSKPEDSDTVEKRMELISLEWRLRNWQFASADVDPDDLVDGDVMLASELYRLACLVSVVKAMDPLLATNSPAVQELVSVFIATLEKLPLESPVNTTLCWPLVVVGCYALVGTHRRIISARLKKNIETYKGENLVNSLRFLRSTWKREKEMRARHSGASELVFTSPTLFDLMQDVDISVTLL